MLELIPDLPSHVLGLEARGQVTAEDYQSVLVPAIESAFGKTGRIRLLYVLGKAFEGYSSAAAWEDAKVGLAHLTRFDRVAVVTDVPWVENTVKAFGFVMPCEVRVFPTERLASAREWVSEPPPAGTLSFEYLTERQILILRPHGELTAADFERVSDEIDPYIEQSGNLRGVLIVARSFPGWDDFGAFAAHLRFVKAHRKQIQRLAVVTDDRLLSVMPYFAGWFLVREARHFPTREESEALAWLSGQSA